MVQTSCIAWIPLAKILQPYHEYTSNIRQINQNHYTTNHHKSIIKYHKNVILYHKKSVYITTKYNTLLHSVVFSTNNSTTNCSICITCYHTMVYYTTNSSVSVTEVVFYHIM